MDDEKVQPAAEGETEGAGLSYSITGGVDQGLFSINATTGRWNFSASFISLSALR